MFGSLTLFALDAHATAQPQYVPPYINYFPINCQIDDKRVTQLIAFSGKLCLG